jgi:hypothetical protein
MTWGEVYDEEDLHPYTVKFKARVTIPATTGTLQVINGSGTLLQLVMEETTGSATARFELWDGRNTGGEYLGPWTLSAGQSFDNAYPPHGIVFRSGLFLNVTSGSVAGAAHIGTRILWQPGIGWQ